MRIYLPATMDDLAAADGLTPRPGHAVTSGLRAELGADDDESAEHAALLLAAVDSIGLVAAHDGAPPRRVVVAADIDPVPVPSGPHVAMTAPAVPWSRVVSFHVDDIDDDRSVQILSAAAAGDGEAAAEAAELDLLWYDVSERLHLLDQGR